MYTSENSQETKFFSSLKARLLSHLRILIRQTNIQTYWILSHQELFHRKHLILIDANHLKVGKHTVALVAKALKEADKPVEVKLVRLANVVPVADVVG